MNAQRPDIALTSRRSGGDGISARQLELARRTLASLPRADRELVARAGVSISLEPRASLGDGVLGACDIVQRHGSSRWEPTGIRIAADTGAKLAEIIRHEVGHAVAVLRSQDRSEDAAHRYAARHA